MRRKDLMWIAVLGMLAGCSHAPVPKAAHQDDRRDETKEAWYGQAVAELAALDREAEALLRAGKRDEAGAVIQRGEPVMKRVLGVPRPTLAATEAASDLDQLYGRMLLSNRHYGWARLEFQKNLARWKRWEPRTAESERRLAAAQAAIDECDRKMGQ